MTFLHCRAYIWNSQLFARKCFLFSTSARQVQVLAGFLQLAVGTLGRLSLGSSHLQIVFFHLHWMMRMRAAHFLALLTLSHIAMLLSWHFINLFRWLDSSAFYTSSSLLIFIVYCCILYCIHCLKIKL
ncbi:hypothetical protein Ddc_13538 [Ditylenchus destructor]|nr:hypothetical protein Ddc_13538 [Ditylenchus destructor]